MPGKLQRRLLRIAWLCMLGCVVVGSLLPSNSLPKRALEALDVNDKLEHFLAYSALALLPALHEKKPVAGLLALAIVLLGVALEFGQVLFSDRLFELGDIAAGTAGVLCGFVAATQLRPRLAKGAWSCLLYTSPSPRDRQKSRMPSSA